MYILVALGDVYFLVFSSIIMRSNATRSDEFIFKSFSHIKKKVYEKKVVFEYFRSSGWQKGYLLGYLNFSEVCVCVSLHSNDSRVI